MEQIDFSTVTEMTGYNVTREQIQRMYTRYRFASIFCNGKDVLEVACGSGQGLGHLAKNARKVVGGDIDANILAKAQGHYKNRKNIELRVMDAHKLPFENGSFDTVLLYEAIYYLSKPDEFLKEAFRVLRENGILIICTANKELSDFNPSPHSYKYYSASELYELLKARGFKNVDMLGDSLVTAKTAKDRVVSGIKKTAVKFNLIPKTMRGKELFKRLFFGRLHKLPPEFTNDMTIYEEPVSISPDMPDIAHKVIFAVARKTG